MSLPLLCALVFVLLLAGALVLVRVPDRVRRAARRRERAAELRRYRLAAAVGDRTPHDAPAERPAGRVRERAVALGARFVQARGSRGPLAGSLERAGMRLRPEEWVAVQAAAVLAGVLLSVIVCRTVLVAPVGAVLGWLATRCYLRRRTARRAAAFETTLPDALQLLAGALRSGFAINQSVAAVVREGVEPVAAEFGRALHEVRLGAELPDALDDVATRMASRDLALVVMALRTAREVGGNLAEILQTTVVTMRERVELRGQVTVLSAEGRLSAKVLVALPILMAVYLVLFKRAYLAPMYTTGVGIVLIAAAALLLVAGSFWLRRLTRIEV